MARNRDIMETLALGVEIGGAKLQVGLGNAAGDLLMLRRGQVPDGADAAVIRAWLARHMVDVLSEAAREGYPTPTRIGVGFGGPVDAAAGRTLISHQVAGWQRFPLKSWLQEQFPGMQVCLENDSNAAGWAEYCLGAGRGTRTFCYMNIGSGIGGALVLDGKLHNGQGLGAAEIGHTWIPDRFALEPGAQARLEDRCSGWAIERRVRQRSFPPASRLWALSKGDSSQITCAMIAEAAREGDAEALDIIDATAQQLAIALANLVTLAHPERIALGGGVAHWGDLLIAPLSTYLNAHVFGPFKDTFTVLPCALEEQVVVVGALLLALQTPGE